MIATLESMAVGEWDVSREAYHADKSCLCNSAICDFRKSVPYFHGRHIAGTITKESTDAMNLGTALHLMVLEPTRIADEIAVAPECDKRTKDGKAQWAEFCKHAGRRLVITEEQRRLCVAMTDAIHSHVQARRAIELPGPVEQPVRWFDAESGLWVRNLFDKRAPSANLIFDLKTSADPTPAAFARSVANFGYHYQDALYRRGARECYGVDHDFLFIVVGSAPPHEVCCYLLDDEAIRLGTEANQKALNEIAARINADDWSSRYSDTIEKINLPRLAFYQETT